MKDNLSPEEKLLRLIRGEKNNPAAVNIPTPPQGHSQNNKISETKDLRVKTDKLLRPISYIDKRRIVAGIFFLSAGILFTSMISFLLRPKTIEIKIKEVIPVKDTTLDNQENKDYNYYFNKIKDKDIFSSSYDLNASSNTIPIDSSDAEIIKDIKLMGIISADPAQAIIEDSRTQKTYYLNKGQFIGELQIEEIKEGKIILNYKGKKYELYL